MNVPPTPSPIDEAGPFENLFFGRTDKIYLSVCIGFTRANEGKADGVYEMSQAEFHIICDDIAAGWSQRVNAAQPIQQDCTPLHVAQACDAQGLGNRWFRLNSTVAKWINSKDPVLIVTAHIG